MKSALILVSAFLLVLFIAPTKGFCGDLIISSELSTPPPGYVIVKDNGPVVAYNMFNNFPFTASFVNKWMSYIQSDLQKNAENIRSNAILNEHVDMRTSPSNNGSLIEIVGQGEAVVLKKQ